MIDAALHALAARLGPEATVEPAAASVESLSLPAVLVAFAGAHILLPETIAGRLADVEPGTPVTTDDEVAGLTAPAARVAGATLTVDGDPVHVLVLVPHTGPVPAIDAQTLRGVPVRVWAELGRTRLPIGRAVGLAPGTVVELDRAADDPVDLYVSGRHFGRGSLVLVDGEWAVEVLEVLAVLNQDDPSSITPASP